MTTGTELGRRRPAGGVGRGDSSALAPGSVYPSRHSAGVGHSGLGRGGQAGGWQRMPCHHHAGTAPPAGSAQLPQRRLLGPLFTAVSDEQVVMCLHIGQGFAAINSAFDAPIDNLIILASQVSALAAQDFLWEPAFRDYPELKVAWSEAGIGWIPFYLNRCDRHYVNQRWLGHDFGTRLPSDIFRDHSLACYVSGPTAMKVRTDIGVNIIAWECDYPPSLPLRNSCMGSWSKRATAVGSSTGSPSSTCRGPKRRSAACAGDPPTSIPPSARSTSGDPCTRRWGAPDKHLAPRAHSQALSSGSASSWVIHRKPRRHAAGDDEANGAHDVDRICLAVTAMKASMDTSEAVHYPRRQVFVGAPGQLEARGASSSGEDE